MVWLERFTRTPGFLVLDEATSALDNQTEAEVMKAIDGLGGEVTIVLIAHRLTTVQNCDRILLLDNGCIAGLGSYSDLLANNHSFQSLISRQSSSLELS